MTEFSALYSRVLRHAAGCPSPVMLSALREAAIDICERGRVWSQSEDYLILAKGLNSIDLSSPDESEIIDVISITYDSYQITPKSIGWLDKNYLGWRTEETNIPKHYYLSIEEDGVVVNIVPKASETIKGIGLRVILRPTDIATGFDTGLFARYKTILVNGALKEILAINKKPWTDHRLSDKYSKRFEDGIAQVLGDNLKSFTSQSLRVNPVNFYF